MCTHTRTHTHTTNAWYCCSSWGVKMIECLNSTFVLPPRLASSRPCHHHQCVGWVSRVNQQIPYTLHTSRSLLIDRRTHKRTVQLAGYYFVVHLLKLFLHIFSCCCHFCALYYSLYCAVNMCLCVDFVMRVIFLDFYCDFKFCTSCRSIGWYIYVDICL